MMGFGKVITGKTPKISKTQKIAKRVDKPLVLELRRPTKAVVSSAFILRKLD